MRPHGNRARVSAQDPTALGQCDRCGKWRNITDLIWQLEWAGTHLFNLKILVCEDTCYDTPNEQLRTIILPPDPYPVLNARVPNFAYEEQTVMIAQFGSATRPTSSQERPWGAGGPQLMLCDQSGTLPFVLQYATSS